MINNVIIFGRLTADVQLSTTSNGISYCLFNIANETGYGDNKKTNFFKCSAWRGTAETISKYMSKGSLIGVSGQLNQTTYEDKNGNRRESVEIMVETVQFCDNRSKTSQNGTNDEDGSVIVNDTTEVVGTSKKASTSQEKAGGFFLGNESEFVPF